MNEQVEAEEWKSATGKTHKDEIRRRVMGSFDLKITTEQDYSAFITHLQNNDQGAMLFDMTVTVNNTNSTKASSFFITELKPVLARNNNGKKYEKFTLQIEEA